ncbi:MAG: Lrp/AsnC family transcriptional regulator [Candidatus Zixiibacteriota bacterium]
MLDALDQEILKALQEDGRMSNKELAAKIDLAQSATSERLRKLRERGLIQRFEVRMDAARLGFGLVAFIFVRTNELPDGARIGETLAEAPEVQEVFNVAGEDCYLIKVRVASPEALGRLLRERIGVIESVVSTRTTIVMETYKETCKLPLCQLQSNGANGPTGDPVQAVNGRRGG